VTLSSKRQTNETLRSDMWRACDILRRDNNVGGVIQYTEHLAWLLFLKFLDEEEKERLAQASLGEGEHYEPVLQGDLAWDAWAGPQKLPTWKGDDLIQFVRGRLLPGLSTLTGSPLARTIARIFSDESVGDQNVVRNVPVCASGYNLKDVLTIVNSIHFDSDDDIYTISQVYEDLLERMGAENRIAGEFYTPRSVIRFMVDVIAPQIGETVYDPACGSAGFLAAAYEFMQPQERTSDDRETLQHKTFFGQEKKGGPDPAHDPASARSGWFHRWHERAMRRPRSRAIILRLLGNRLHPHWRQGAAEIQVAVDRMIERYREALAT